MYYLPETSTYGKVNIISEYIRYDVPRAFVIKNRLNKKAFVYWTDEFDDADGWYYVDINDDEQHRVEAGDIQVRDLFNFKNVLSVRTPYDASLPIVENYLSCCDVDQESLPPIGFGFKMVDDGSFELVKKQPGEFKTDNSYHEVRLYKQKSHKPLSWGAVQRTLGAWGDLCQSLLDFIDPKTADFIPAQAEPGSYLMHFKTSHNHELIQKFSSVATVLATSNPDEIISRIKDINVEPELVENLISVLTENELMFDIRTNSGGAVATINYKSLSDALNSLNEFNQMVVTSDNVPQADDISRVIFYVHCKSMGEPFNSETEHITPRQISYYETAARILGFATKSGVLTPVGHRLAEAYGNEVDSYKIIIDRFETSICGWAWMKYSEVKSVCEIDSSTAADFLLECSKGLSEQTARRRATTLKNWIEKFKQFC